MSKTIEDVVIALGGIWPKEESDSCFGEPVLCECIQQTGLRSVGDIVCCGDQFRQEYFSRVCNQHEFNAAADRMRGKPDWKDAPEWAQWLAQDSDGVWYFYASEIPPSTDDSYFIVDEQHNVRATKGSCLGDWCNTLEKRPEHIDEAAEKHDPLNGYEWGVEYQTDGKKPNLPGDVEVKCTLRAPSSFESETCRRVSFWDWKLMDHDTDIKSFKITDQRYKPEQEPAPTKPWFEAGELPPVGTVCECFDYDVSAYVTVKVLDASTKSKEMAVAVINGDSYSTVFWGCKFRPIKTDKEKAIEAAVTAAFDGLKHASGLVDDVSMNIIVNSIYDAGLLRLPEQK